MLRRYRVYLDENPAGVVDLIEVAGRPPKVRSVRTIMQPERRISFHPIRFVNATASRTVRACGPKAPPPSTAPSQPLEDR